MRNWEMQLREVEKIYNYQYLTKNLPLKAPSPSPFEREVFS
jgi:hypothetical protein